MTEIFDKLRSRPGLFLLAYDQRFHAGTICVTFLHDIFYNLDLGCPEQVDIVVTDHYFTMTAAGGSLDIGHNYSADLARFFNIANFHPSMSSSVLLEKSNLDLFGPIVWFTEYCLVDITTPKETYRQVFLSGTPLGETILLSASTNEPNKPRIAFCFTVPQIVFESTVLDVTSLKRVVSIWKKRAFAGLPKDKQLPKLGFKWKQQDEYNYSLRIVTL
jgi:hypothetical protein